MKKMLCIIPITFLALMLIIGMGNQNCLADTIPDPIDGSGHSILLVDGKDDTNTTVVFNIIDFGVPGDLDYRINSGTWTNIIWSGKSAQLSSEGGDTLDFRLTYSSMPYYSNNISHATLTYSGGIAFDNAEKPPRSDPFYDTVMVDWTGLPVGTFKLEVLTTPGVDDGFAPVPIPSSVLLLGAGLLGLIGIGFRRKKSTAAKFEE